MPAMASAAQSNRMKSLLLAPWWAMQLLSGAKSFIDNPLIGSRRLNARGLHVARVRLAARMAAWRRRRLAKGVPAEWRDAFERDGFVKVEGVLPPAEFAAMRAALLAYQAPAREMRQGDAITRRMAVDPAMLAAVPGLAALLARADIVALFHYVASFRTTPLHYVQTIVSRRPEHEGGNEPDPQEALHADSFHSSMKAWLFLNDVEPDDGPFTFVRGSHRFTPERLAWERRRSLADPRGIDRLSARGSPRLGDGDLAAMQLPHPEGLAVPAGTLIVADTVGFHARGASARPGERVELWSYSRRNPFLPWTGGDLLSLSGIAERRIGWLWALRDRLERRIGQPWRDVGVRRAVD